MSSAGKVALVCTVGGSAQPIMSAIRALQPEVVWFVVSARQGAETSRTQVDGKMGLAAFARDHSCKETTILEVPADNPDRALSLIGSWFGELQAKYANHRVIADYTGGTKSMSAALLMAAMARTGVEIQFMCGDRQDLSHIVPGTEKPQRMLSDFVVADRQMSLARSLVRGWSYAAALVVLDALALEIERRKNVFKPPKKWMRNLDASRRICQILSNWDAFRHHDANALLVSALDDGMAYVDRCFDATHITALKALADAGTDTPSWWLCSDLYRNAERLAGRGRYDDAIARLYRLTEAAIQTHLYRRHRLRSGALPIDKVPEELRRDMNTRLDRKTNAATVELPLLRTLALIEHYDHDDPLIAGWERREDGRLASPAWQGSRNKSILAHGFRPVDRNTWVEAKTWVDKNLSRFWKGEDVPALPADLPG